MKPEDSNEPDQNEIPLSNEQVESLKVLQDNIQQSFEAIENRTAEVDSQAVLSKMATGGQKPDYARMSTEDLMSIYDNAVRSSTLNTLSDGIDPDTQEQVAKPHPHSVIAVAEKGQKTAEMTREELIAGIDAVLESQNYDYDPQKIATAQGMAINAQAAELEGRADRCQQAYLKMQEEIPGYKNLEIEDQIAELKAEAAKFSELSEQKCAGYVHAGLAQKMEHLSAAGGNNAKQAAEAIEKAKQGLDPTNMSGGTKHLRKIDSSLQELDMSNMNFKNVDLSQANLEGVKLNPKALSEAKGLDKVKGLDPAVQAEALGIQRIDKLEARKAHLQEKPGIKDHIKGFFKHGPGGVKAEIEHINHKIEATKEAMDRKLNQGMSLDDQREVVKQREKLGKLMDKEVSSLRNEASQLAQDNALQVKSQNQYETDNEKISRLDEAADKLKEDKISVKEALKKEAQVMKAMEKIEGHKQPAAGAAKIK